MNRLQPINIDIDFHDGIYKKTGIKEHSISIKEHLFSTDVKSYVLQAIKVNTGRTEAIYLSLKDENGEPVSDLKVAMGASIYYIDKKVSQDSVVIENIQGKELDRLEISSSQENLHIVLRLLLERPDEIDLSIKRAAQTTSNELFDALAAFLKDIGKEGEALPGTDCIDETLLLKLADSKRKTAIEGEALEHLLRPCFYCAGKFIAFYKVYGQTAKRKELKKESTTKQKGSKKG